MLSVFDVAKYFLSLSDEEAGDTISNLKLQKLLYYAQGFNLALFSEPLFNEQIEAWTHGPVIPVTYSEYKKYGANTIPNPTDFDSELIDKQSRDLLDEVYNVYGQYSAWKLRNMTHIESPWVNAYNAAPSSVVDNASMESYFKTLVQ